jgi:hypothetical protein
MIDNSELINQNTDETGQVEEFTANNSNKKRIGIVILACLVIFIVFGEFAINNYIQRKNKEISIKNADNGVLLDEERNNNNKLNNSVTSDILSPTSRPTVFPSSKATSSPKPSSTPVPVKTTVPTQTPAPTVTSAPIVLTPSIDSISPSSGPVGQEFTLKGNNFGTTTGSVIFCLQGNCSGGAPIVSWEYAQIKARVPGIITQAGSYELYVRNDNTNASGNRVTFTITAGQPVINSISPSGAKPGGELVITGSNFGSSGQINFYKSYPTLSGTGNVTSWSNSEIRMTIPSGFEGNTEYGIQVLSGGAESSFKYYTLGAN